MMPALRSSFWFSSPHSGPARPGRFMGGCQV